MIRIEDERYPIMRSMPWNALTPMLKQYYEIKGKYLDYLLFYRLGDFYELFFDDAVKAAQLLEITLTNRGVVDEKKVPLCGVPYHSVESYLKKAIDGGFKIAICEQIEDPQTVKGIVKRGVVRIITAGTIFDGKLLNSHSNNYIAAITERELCYCDISTGIIKRTKVDKNLLISELRRINPSEIIYESEKTDDSIISLLNPDILTDASKISEINLSPNVESTDLLLSYIAYTSKQGLDHIGKPLDYKPSNSLQIDPSTIKNLELLETMSGKREGSLLNVLDITKTAMGARLLRASLTEALLDIEAINNRHEFVDFLKGNLILRSEIRHYLNKIYDIERLIAKLIYNTINPRDLLAILSSLDAISDLKRIATSIDDDESSPQFFNELFKALDPIKDLAKLIFDSISDTVVTTKLGVEGFIKEGYSEALDYQRRLKSEGKNLILELEQRERQKTGIKTLKTGYNRIFGYYIEISRSAAASAPESYIRKQTLANCERYITDELKEIEDSVLNAEDKARRIENQLFVEIKDSIIKDIPRLQHNGRIIAIIDMLSSFAESAFSNNYCRPLMSADGQLLIEAGRHPVIEKFGSYIPNDCIMDTEKSKIHIITGPNMAGKSSYLRQTALICLMAQIGSFVPADKARLGIIDRIFTRVGASDDLSSGRSTFMVEMTELANILDNFTNNSLIILDEIGRGTATYDGLSIATAVIEYLSKHKSKTLFATHYHELTELENTLNGINNFSISVQQQGNDIIFLRKIVQGPALKSYGIEVAALAGVKEEIVLRAKELLAEHSSSAPPVEDFTQISIMDESKGLLEKMKEELNINPDDISPRQAHDLIYKLKEILNVKNN